MQNHALGNGQEGEVDCRREPGRQWNPMSGDTMKLNSCAGIAYTLIFAVNDQFRQAITKLFVVAIR